MPERQQDAETSPEARLRAAYEQAESRTAKAFEEAVNTPSFGALLARSAENVAALSRIRGDLADLVLRNLRVAGRADITRLARQLHRTEDKLERVLQEVEALRDELARARRESGDARAARESGDARAARESEDPAADKVPASGNGRAKPSPRRPAGRAK